MKKKVKDKKSSNIIKDYWNKFWFLLWKDDSMKGWIFSVVFLFIFIKLIFFPVLSITTGTTLPLAIVESCSMFHEGNYFSNFDNFWETKGNKYEDFNLEKDSFLNFKFRKGFNKGDILFIVGTPASKLNIGDVIVFQSPGRNPIIHRIMEIEEAEEGKRIFSTVGDNNNGQLPIEKAIDADMIVGRAVFRLAPYIGWVKLIFFEPSKPLSERGFCKV